MWFTHSYELSLQAFVKYELIIFKDYKTQWVFSVIQIQLTTITKGYYIYVIYLRNWSLSSEIFFLVRLRRLSRARTSAALSSRFITRSCLLSKRFISVSRISAKLPRLYENSTYVIQFIVEKCQSICISFNITRVSHVRGYL